MILQSFPVENAENRRDAESNLTKLDSCESKTQICRKWCHELCPMQTDGARAGISSLLEYFVYLIEHFSDIGYN